MNTISDIWFGLQRHLFPFLEEELGTLNEFYRKVAATMAMVRIEAGISDNYWVGRPMSSRKALGHAFAAKAVSNAPATRNFRDQILTDSIPRRMCGWEERDQAPSEATFSRSFGEEQLPEPTRIERQLSFPRPVIGARNVTARVI